MRFLLAQIPTIPEIAGQIVDQVKANPQLLAILIGVGVLTAVLFVWGIMKHAIKAAIIGGILSVGAWFWYFNIR
ncbi:MAG: hypothetical protein A2135_03905 [Actinobacteria bacterium RBG_16_67_15]|nr:MAG: hypothetical protein A2135_03905 [Actinobacteria bacterium RBG_16_67_15]